MGIFKDLSGKKFGRLTVISRHGSIPKKPRGERITWLCKCDCGKDKVALGEKLVKGSVSSCGCIISPPEHEQHQRLRKRIKKSSHINAKTGCWEWQRYLTSCGYGWLCYRGRSKKVHRVSWIVFIGPIPKGLCVLHKCDNPKCVNPEHLFLGTMKDNVDDMTKKGRRNDVGPAGMRSCQAKLTDDQVNEIRMYVKTHDRTWKIYKELSEKYCVGADAIYNIIKRNTWKHLHDPE